MLIRFLFLLLFALTGMARAEEPLPPEQAFRFARRQITRPRFCCRYDLRQLRYSMA